MSIKLISYYLPQFHEIKENDEWWGKGFTEWTNVKKACPLFPGHVQPLKPLNQNYYNLLEKDTVEWQTRLMNKYGLYGMAYYHYWSKGNMLLEKPAENLLKWKEINQKFMFFWANHNWIKSVNGKKTVIWPQEYGGQEDWEKHYNYLISYFKDDRYIKVNNAPVFGIYIPSDIQKLSEMQEYFIKRAKKDGFSGIFFIESLNLTQSRIIGENTSAAVVRQPNLAFEHYMNKNILKRINRKFHSIFSLSYLCKYNYEKYIESEYFTNKLMLSDIHGKSVYCGMATGWDNTSRHGRRGQVILGKNPDIFQDELKKLIKLSKEKESDFIFINAWNEWAEGMYLEPDEYNGYLYLEKILSTVRDE